MIIYKMAAELPNKPTNRDTDVKICYWNDNVRPTPAADRQNFDLIVAVKITVWAKPQLYDQGLRM